MGREVTTHRVNGCNNQIRIFANKEANVVGSPSHYQIVIENKKRESKEPSQQVLDLRFQSGAIRDGGVNGITHEVLLAILRDRLEQVQQTDFACDENDEVLTHLESAMLWLQKRNMERRARISAEK